MKMEMEIRNQKSNQLKKAGIKICVSIMATFALLMSENTFGAVTQDPGSNSGSNSCGSSSAIDPLNGAGFGPLIGGGGSTPSGTANPLYCNNAETLRQTVDGLKAAICELQRQIDESLPDERSRHEAALEVCRARPDLQDRRECIAREKEQHERNKTQIIAQNRARRTELAAANRELREAKSQLKNYCRNPQARGCPACQGL